MNKMRSQVPNLSPLPPLGDDGENCREVFFSGEEAGGADGEVAPDGVLGSNIFPSTMRYENTEKNQLEHPLDGNFLLDGQPLLPILPEKDDYESDDCLFGLEERTPIHEVVEQITASPPPNISKEGKFDLEMEKPESLLTLDPFLGLDINNGPETPSSDDFLSLGLDIKNRPETLSSDDFLSLGMDIKKEPETPSLDDLMNINSETLPQISRSLSKPLKCQPRKQTAVKIRKKACSMCRSSKTKCEGPRPCRRCVKLGRPEMCTPQITLPTEMNESKKRALVTRKRQRETEMHTLEYDPYVCFAAGLVYKNNIDLMNADGFSVQINLKSSRKRLKDEESLYKGQQCYRNSWCVRQFRHCGHCKPSQSLQNPKKRKMTKSKEFRKQ
eukprot:jgi/Bigna1/90897/estExt_fgenesh1_pg.C_820043